MKLLVPIYDHRAQEIFLYFLSPLRKNAVHAQDFSTNLFIDYKRIATGNRGVIIYIIIIFL